ncbi:MAG TPA: nitroreductase family protein [Spirochaetota bacterium]|nr:nitroreductase family protein [Spirochaetota bacterium]
MNILDAIKERRSINFFDPDRTVTDEQINELISLANLSPSSLNLQPWEVIAVTDPRRKAILRKCAYDQPKVTEASATLIIIANPNAIEENVDSMVKSWVDLGYIKPEDAASTRQMPFNSHGDKDSISRKIFAVKNTAFFAMSLMIAAKGLGLETHPMDGFSSDKIKSEFNIPEDRIIPLLISVGYLKPGVKLLPRAWRRDLKSFVKFNNYK